MNTYPRDPPTWDQALVDAARAAAGYAGNDADANANAETPMWDLEFIDSPWADAQAQFKTIAAHDQEWRREVKGARLELEARWKEEKEAADPRTGAPPAVPATHGAAPATPGPERAPAAAPATPSDPLVAPGSAATGKKKPSTKPPTLSKAAQQANARKLEEQRSAQQMTQELTRSMGRKRKAWMLGGGPAAASPAATPKTPTADFKKRRKLDGQDVEMSPAPRTPGSPSPASPSPLGQRAPGFTAVPSGLNPHAKRVKSVAPDEVEPVKSESGTPTPAPEEAVPSTVYQFPDVPDRLTQYDVKTALERRLRRGGSFQRVLQHRYEMILLDIAKKEHVAWTTAHAGGLQAAAAAQTKKEVKPGTGLLGMTRKTAGPPMGGR